MKKTSLLLCALVMLMATAFKSNNDCDSYFPVEVGTKWELSAYEGEYKNGLRTVYELIDLNPVTDGLEAIVSYEVFDSENRSFIKSKQELKCTSKSFFMDISPVFQKEQYEGMEGVTIELTNQFWEFPAKVVPNEILPDAKSSITVTKKGKTIKYMEALATNRKVLGSETITTPVGEFDCEKYSYDTEVTFGGKSYKSSSVIYMTKGIGIVRMETLDESTKYQSKALLTAISNY
jgi:hypothetical protein